jgi:hypothetical protein
MADTLLEAKEGKNTSVTEAHKGFSSEFELGYHYPLPCALAKSASEDKRRDLHANHARLRLEAATQPYPSRT